MSKYTDEELLRMLRNKADELGRAPKPIEVDEDYEMPSATLYRQRFGDYDVAVRKAKLIPARCRGYSEEELVVFLQKKATEMGKKPTMLSMDVDTKVPSSSTFVVHFGSWKKALEVAGLK